MEISFATRPASPTAANEDFIAATPQAVVVLDGAGVPEGMETGCTHGTLWFVQQLGAHLLAQLVTEPAETLADTLAHAIAHVGELHAGDCDLDHPGTPSASVALLREHPDVVDYLVLGDCTAVLDHRGSVEAITDDRIARIARSERATLNQHQAGSDQHATELRRLVDAQHQHRNRPGGYWVASTVPDAAYQALTGTVPSQQLACAAIMTDGAARLVERFHLATWPDVLDLVDQHGPSALIDQVRQAEYTDTHGQQWPRGKPHDDATIALCRITSQL
jgi:Protein phosphatase 2C